MLPCGVEEPTAGMIVEINQVLSDKSVPLPFPAREPVLEPIAAAMIEMMPKVIDQAHAKDVSSLTLPFSLPLRLTTVS